jgi:4-carboxymuconolactone decarboxylase
MTTSRYDIGWAKLREIHGQYGPAVLDRLNDIAPELKQWVIEFAFGEVYSRPQLDLKSRQIATLAALVCLHHGGAELKAHVRGAIQAGCSRQEVIEVVMQMAIYAGFPAAITAMASVREAFTELDAGVEEPRQI